uniref:TonB-dependent receptor n=1 Tax=candidate division WOR-3 bacterium TaxID=2052148 RepID=A0A7C4GGE1_UNCW3
MRLFVLIPLLCSSLAAAEFSGVVLDAWTRQPVPFALIEVLAADIIVAADSLGRFSFRLASADSPADVTVSRAGYRQWTWSGLKPGSHIELALIPTRYDLKAVTVTALRLPVLLAAGPASVVRPAETGLGLELTDAARLAPTAELRDYVNYTSVGLRGAGNEHTLIELDGVRLNSAQSGTFDLSTLSPLLADRIEIARGGSSAAHGSSAIGGVVNIITPEPETLSARIQAGLGSFGRRRLDLAHTLPLGRFGFFVAGQLLSSRNDFNWPDSLDSLRTMRNADISRRSGAVKTVYRHGPVRASFLGELSAAERGVPGSTRWPSDSARRADDRGLLIAACDIQPAPELRTAARLHYSAADQRYRDPDWATNDTHRLRVLGARIDQSFRPVSWLLLLAGAEVSSEALQSTALGRPERFNPAGWVQWRIERHGFDINHVLRLELLRQQVRRSDSTRSSSLLSVFSPKVTLSWSGLQFVNLYTGFSRSFRAPGFNDLYWPEDAFTYGNPDLKPETGTTLDAGIGGTRPGWLVWWLGGYHTRLTDLIQWQPDSLWRFHPVNVDRATITGLELEIRADLRQFGFSAAGNICSARADSFALIYRPGVSGRASVWFTPPLSTLRPRLFGGVDYTGARFADAANTDKLPAHALVNTGIALAPRLGRVDLRIETGLKNLLDVNHETARGYPSPGRNWFLELGLGI